MDFNNIDYAIQCAKLRGYITICTIDIGYRNFAICIEKLKFPIIKTTNIIYQGDITFFKKIDFGVRTKDGIKDRKIFCNCQDFLDSIIDKLKQCDIILLEQQLRKNPFAQKFEMFVYSYLIFMFREFKYYSAFPAKHKTKVLKAPSGLDKPQRKKWCIEKCYEILTDRQDKETLSLLSSHKKADDLSDTFCMIQAWKILNIKRLL